MIPLYCMLNNTSHGFKDFNTHFKDSTDLIVLGRHIISSWKRMLKGGYKQYHLCRGWGDDEELYLRMESTGEAQLYNLLMVQSGGAQMLLGVITSDRWYRNSLVKQSSSAIVQCSVLQKALIYKLNVSLFCCIEDTEGCILSTVLIIWCLITEMELLLRPVFVWNECLMIDWGLVIYLGLQEF